MNVCKYGKWNASLGTPIGVCVVPTSHMDGEGNGIMMSLANMSLQNPENGSLADVYVDGDNCMPWGEYGVDVPNLLTCDHLPVRDIDGVSDSASGWTNVFTDEGTKTVITFSDFDTNEIVPENIATKRKECYFSNGYCIICKIFLRDSLDEEWYLDETEEYDSFVTSPYNTNGSKNKDFFMEGTIFEEGISGKANTQAILAMCTDANKNATPVSTEVKTSSSSSTVKNNYPAAICASRFHTEGTKKGDWYLPSLAELVYLAARYNKVNASLKALGKNAIRMGELGVINNNIGSLLCSSSQNSTNHEWGFSSEYYCVSHPIKYYNYTYGRVRAFCAF